LEWARTAAQAFETDHTEVIVTGESVASQYDQLVHAIDQPSLDGTNTFLVSLAAGKAVKVALSGLGGDELFAGYPHFKAFAAAARWDARLARLGAAGKKQLLNALPGRYFPGKHVLRMARVGRYATLRQLCGVGQQQDIVNADFMADVREPARGPVCQWLRPDRDVVAETSYVEIERIPREYVAARCGCRGDGKLSSKSGLFFSITSLQNLPSRCRPD
jgi:asparagine synthetase B (glutamine-hydrolysing)